MACRCKTINLAVISIDTLKKMEGQIPKNLGRKSPPPICHENMPPPPRPVAVKKIIVCSARPMEFECQPAPCPCPPCETPPQRLARLLAAGAKLFLLYALARWSVKEGLWEGHQGSARFTLDLLEKHFSDQSGMATLPNIQLFKYHIMNTWDKVIGNFFYYLITYPLKLISSPSRANEEKKRNTVNLNSECECS